MIPYWCHLLNLCRWRGEDRLKEGVFSLQTIETCAIQRVNWQDKRFKCLWKGYGSRCQAHRFECVQNCNAAGFFKPLPMCTKKGPPPKGHPSHLTQLWEILAPTRTSIPVELFRHLVESMPRWIEGCSGQNGVQLNSRMVFLMFCALSIAT
jgi:hypothetical protein